MDISGVFAVISTILLYVVGFSAQILKNKRDPGSTEAIHPLIYFLGACSLVSFGIHGWLTQNMVLLLSMMPGVVLGSVIILQFLRHKLRKRRVLKSLMLQNQRRVPRLTIRKSS